MHFYVMHDHEIQTSTGIETRFSFMEIVNLVAVTLRFTSVPCRWQQCLTDLLPLTEYDPQNYHLIAKNQTYKTVKDGQSCAYVEPGGSTVTFTWLSLLLVEQVAAGGIFKVHKTRFRWRFAKWKKSTNRWHLLDHRTSNPSSTVWSSTHQIFVMVYVPPGVEMRPLRLSRYLYMRSAKDSYLFLW
jgi:hypothetical protein